MADNRFKCPDCGNVVWVATATGPAERVQCCFPDCPNRGREMVQRD